MAFLSADSLPDTRVLGRRAGRLPLLVPAAASLGLLIGGLVVSSIRGGVFPSPHDPALTIAAYIAEEGSAMRTLALFLFVSALALLTHSGALASRLRTLGASTAPGVVVAAGSLSAAMLSLSALSVWVLARAGERSVGPETRALHDMVFVTGGVAHVVLLGVLTTAGALAARRHGLLPRGLTTAGALIGIVGIASTVSLVVPALSVLLPLGRFPALVWLIVTAVLLPPADESRTS